MMKQTMHKSTTAAIWLAAVAVIALVAKPTSAWAQNPKTFTEYVNEIIETQQEQDEPEGERVFFTPYLTNDTHYMVISDISINTLYNVCEGAFCVMDNNLLTVWSVDGAYLFGPNWKPLGLYDTHPMCFDNGALLVKSAKKNSLGKEYYSILYKNGAVRNLDPSWEPQSRFVDGLAAVTKKQGYTEMGNFFINTRGEKMPSPSNLYFGYDGEKTRALRCGLRAFETKDHKWGYMDEKCQVVLQPQWDKVRDFSEGYAWTFKRNTSDGTHTATLIDKTGKVVQTVPSFSAMTSLSRTYMIGDVCDGKYYLYSNDSEPTTTYYDLKGNALAISHGGTSFYEGHALVRGVKDTWDRILLVDDDFTVMDSYPTYASGGHDIYADELWVTKPFEPFGLHTIHSGSVVIDSRGRLVLKEMSSPWSSDYIRGFSQPSKDGYIVANNINVGDKRYLALIKYTGEIAWLFSAETFSAKDLTGFIKAPNFNDTTIIVKDPPITDKPKGPTQVTDATYKVNIVCSPKEGGTASVVGKSPIKYGDKVSIKPAANEGWVASSINVEKQEVGEDPFMITDDVTATVYFLQRPVFEPIDRTNTYEGKVKIMELDDAPVYVTLYATMSKDKDISCPFGDKTYGYLTLMLDPKMRYNGKGVSVNGFFPPMKIVGFQHEGGKQYLVADGGSVMYHDLRITTNDLLANLWFNLLVRMDGFESGSIVPRRYRIEMTNVNEKTGECTLGNLEVFSRSKGWVPGQDPSIARHTASKFPSLSGGAHDLGIAADYFKGCTLKLAKKRDDVLWYPPLEWAKSQTEYDKKIEKMKDTYLHFITDCEALFGL